MDNVKKIVAVASGKGGVGKSTTSVNLAVALKQAGYSVGLLDADIYGPSIAMMLGVAEGTKPAVADGSTMQPVMAHGIQTMSMAYLVTDKTPMVWRGPMAAGALQQLLGQTAWDDLDYLIVDMPPGTGDIQLTLAQNANIDGAVIVTTPQDIALLDAQKGIEMFRKVNVPVLGVVENMSVHVCSNCGHEEHVFGIEGGKALAEEYGVSLIGQLPLSMAVRVGMDSGSPEEVVSSEELGGRYKKMAKSVVDSLDALGDGGVPEITIS